MAALVKTPANVAASPAAVRTSAPAGAVYIDATGKAQPSNVGTALGAAVPTGIAANSAAVGQLVDIIQKDPAFTHGLTGVNTGDTIWGHNTAANLTNTPADNVTGTFTTIMGIAISATQMKLQPFTSGVAHA